jgi:hypothetical protein
MQNYPDSAEEQLYNQLTSVRLFARNLLDQKGGQGSSSIYEAIDCLVAAAEALMEGIADDGPVWHSIF